MAISPSPEDMAQIDRAVEALTSRLGGSMQAAYLFGSAVAGGLRPASDLDLLVASSEPLRGGSRARLVHDLLEISAPVGAPHGRPLEVTVVVIGELVPWRYPPRREFQFGEWLRSELLAGRIAPPGPDPDLAILLATARQFSVTLAGPPVAMLFDPVPAADVRRATIALVSDVIAGARGDERNVVLTVARMWTTLASGEILPKDVAAERMLAALPDEHRDVLALARAAYRGECHDDWSRRGPQVDAFLQHAARMLSRSAADLWRQP